jgi:hypothetical protein
VVAKMKESLKRNRLRVFEIYGVGPKDKNYECHHIIFKSDKKNNELFKDFDVNKKSNLYPLDKKVHIGLHRKVSRNERK